jgi:hypothetical protein
MYQRALSLCDAGLERIGRPIASGDLGCPCGFFQKFVDQCLIGFVPFCGQAPELSEEPGRNADRDELFRVSGFRTANPARSDDTKRFLVMAQPLLVISRIYANYGAASTRFRAQRGLA